MYKFTNEQYAQAQIDYNVANVNLLIEVESPVFSVLNDIDKENISLYYENKYDWELPAREQLLNAMECYVKEKFPRKPVNITFNVNGREDETQFDVESLYELGQLWVEFANENDISVDSFTGYYDGEEI